MVEEHKEKAIFWWKIAIPVYCIVIIPAYTTMYIITGPPIARAIILVSTLIGSLSVLFGTIETIKYFDLD